MTGLSRIRHAVNRAVHGALARERRDSSVVPRRTRRGSSVLSSPANGLKLAYAPGEGVRPDMPTGEWQRLSLHSFLSPERKRYPIRTPLALTGGLEPQTFRYGLFQNPARNLYKRGTAVYVDKHIDWLSATFKSVRDPREVFPTYAWRFVGRGLHGYQTRYVDTRSGAEIHTDSRDTRMGHHIRFGGDAIAEAERWYSMDGEVLVRRLVSVAAKSSRIDLAINIHGGVLTPALVRDALKASLVKAKAKTWRFIEGSSHNTLGDTLYLGSPKSDLQIRIYDKNAERRIVSPEAWVRLEMQLRNVRANAAMYSCNQNGIEATVTGFFREQMTYDHPEIAAAYDGPSVEPKILPRLDSNRQRWLLGQVVQALAKEIALDERFGKRFNDALVAEVTRLTDQDRMEA